MDIKEWTKQFWLKVLKKIEDHVVAVVAGVIISIGSVLCVIFWGWLKATHSLTMYGWAFVTLLLIVGLLPISIFWLRKQTKRRILYREDGEILIVLEDKLRDLESQKKSQIRIDFRIWDRKLSLAKGRAQKLLPQVVEKDKTWEVKSRSGNAMTIRRKQYTFTVGPNGPWIS